MPRVRFTDLVDKVFGGIYVTPFYSAVNGTERLISPKEAKQINADHPGLIKVIDAKVDPGDEELPG